MSIEAQMGITASGARDYQSQFGINLAPREIVGIDSGSSHLIMDIEEPKAEAAVLSALITQAQQSFELTEGEDSMFIAEIPVEFQQPVEMYVVANADTAQQGNEVESYKMGACQVINREADIFPTSHAKDYMLHYVSPEKYPLFRVTRTDIDIQITEPPQHGRLIPETTDPDNFRKNRYKYYADKGFRGTELFVINVGVDGIIVRYTTS